MNRNKTKKITFLIANRDTIIIFLGGFAISKSIIDSNPFYLLFVIPLCISLTNSFYGMHISKIKIRKLEKEFKDRYGFDIRDTEALNKYLDKIIRKDD